MLKRSVAVGTLWILLHASQPAIASEHVSADDSLFASEESVSALTEDSHDAEPPMWSSDSSVIDLTDNNFDELVNDGKEAPWFVEFYAPWCGHCKSLAPEWEQLAKMVKLNGAATTIAKVDATAQSRLAKEFEIQGFPSLKLIEQRKMYDYQGERTADAMAAWVAGEYKKEMALSLPKDKTVIDNLKINMKQLLDGVGQVQQFMPALLPSIFLAGLLGGFFLAYSCGFLRRSRIPSLTEQFDVKITRDEKGSAGMIIDPMTMVVMQMQTGFEQKLERIKVGDMVIAVNKQCIIDSDDYRRLATNVPEFTLTFARAGIPTTATSSNGHTKAD